jgi:hypothetical protein
MNNPTSLPPISIITLKFRSGKRKASHGGVPWPPLCLLCWWRRERLAAAAGAAGLHALALTDLHGGLVVNGGVAHALLDLAGHGEESLFDVAGVLGGGLEEGDAEAVCELLGGCKYCSLFGRISAASRISRTFATL